MNVAHNLANGAVPPVLPWSHEGRLVAQRTEGDIYWIPHHRQSLRQQRNQRSLPQSVKAVALKVLRRSPKDGVLFELECDKEVLHV